ncbi:phage terminase large subunit [Brevibacillus sp. NSP2.1]|nr:phage terminase large subunit [Brevibacillus sp. NSP2.1]
MIDTLRLGRDKLRKKLEAGTITADEAVRLRDWITEIKRLERIHRAEVDLLYFAYEYFGEMYNPDNSGNWIPCPIEEAPAFHHELCDVMSAVSTRDFNAKIGWAAPRSHAKSSYLSKAFPLHEIVFRKRQYIIIISETPAVATSNLDWLANQLKSNAKLRADFGPLLHPKQQVNPKDNTSEFIAWEARDNDEQRLLTLVQAASTGQALRGRNWNGYRPDLIICDDLESKKNTNTAELRQEMRDWFTQTVMPLGDPAGKKTAIVFMGTMVHAESLLRYVLDRADFKSRLFKALIDEPERMDLWEKCRDIYLNAENPNRADDAEAFYLANKDEMDRGASVLWPDVQPLWKLMKWKWDNGSKAFSTEYQNTPIDEESQIFVPDKFRYYDESDLVGLSLEVYAFWDIAFGKSKRADYNAIVSVGRDRKTGILYVLDAWAKRCPAHVALEEAVEKIREFGHRSFGVETVQAQHDLYRQLQERLGRERIYGTRLKPIISRKKKEERIESLEPLVENGFLRFNRSHRLLIEQLEHFPGGTYDDLPDALAGAVDLAGGTRPKRRAFYTKPNGL